MCTGKKIVVIVLGIVLLVAGFFMHIPILWTLGLIVVVAGVVLAIAGSLGHGLRGRRHYY